MSQEPPRRKRLPFRWLSLAEFVGILALVIASLGYWDAHRERAQTDQQRAAAERERKDEARAGALKLAFLMTGAPDGDGARLRLASAHPEQVIQTQSLSFPREVRGDAVQTTGNPRIEAGWLDAALARADHARAAHTGPSQARTDRAHQGRLPVGIVTVYIQDGQTRTDRAVYLLGYSLHPRVLRADRVELEGLSLVRRAVGEDVQAAADSAWARQAPPAP